MATQRKRPFTIKRLIDEANETISLVAYGLDDKPTGHRARFEARKASSANRQYAMLFGFNQTIGDTAALGQGTSLDAKFKAMQARIEHLESGADEWEASGRQPGEGTLLFQALMRQKAGRDEAKTLAYVKSLSRSKRDAMLVDTEERNGLRPLAEIVAELRTEAGKGVDVGVLFDELDGLDAEEG